MNREAEPSLPKKAVAKAQLPHLPTGVPMLRLFDQKTFGNVHADYEAMLDQSQSAAQAYASKAKLKTALCRQTLPGFGWRATEESWTDCMQRLTLQDLSRALEVQEQVVAQSGETVSDDSRRVYRSSLKKFVAYAQEQPDYHTALGTKGEAVAPRMHTHKKRQEHWHRLKPKEIPTRVTDELEQVTRYLGHTRAQTPYGGTLVEGMVSRYRRELLDILSWLYRIRGEPLATLSLECLVPKAAITDTAVAAQVAALLHDYLAWLEHDLGLGRSGRAFAIRSCIYLAEFWEYEQITRV
jgi:hypothetical protein